MNHWQVIAPGLLTTVQDQGRHGLRHLGIGQAGALDQDAAWLANALLGNPDDAALLELTLLGPTLHLPSPTQIALTGAPIQAYFQSQPLPMNRPLQLPAGTLKLGRITPGVRSYVAVAGGFQTTPVLGSRSTDLRGGFGGLDGGALMAGDRLPVSHQTLSIDELPQWPGWWINDDDIPSQSTREPIRYVPSSLPAAARLAQRAWTASPRSDRQGLRLQGQPLTLPAQHGVSEPVAPGTIQLPPDGQPIILLADAQTVGGYPRLGYVIGPDLPRLAQIAPAAQIHFQPVTQAQAFIAACERRARMARIKLALHARKR